MTDKIKKALSRIAPAAWRIEKTEEESAELFFVKKQLDTRRFKEVTRYSVSVFRDEADKRGSTTVVLPAELPYEEIEKRLREAYEAAAFAMNPACGQPEALREKVPVPKTSVFAYPLPQAAYIMTMNLFREDRRPDAFINSAELFVERCKKRVISSEGTDVSWSTGSVKGEFVAQCREPEDVEIYQDFEYDNLQPIALSELVYNTLCFAADRARAQRILKSGEYDLILTGDKVGTVLRFYADRSSAAAVYTGYSGWKKGETVQEGAEGFETLDMSLVASEPYSSEGIAMKDRPLLEKGVLKTLHGENRFCRYLGEEATGRYRKIRCSNAGSAPLEELKKAPCLWAAVFSDFQMDPLSGYFGGEIRLAYLIEGDRITPVTGGSVSCSLLEKQSELLLSTERFKSARYEGPMGIRVKGVSVAGNDQ